MLLETVGSDLNAAVLATRLHEVPKEPFKTTLIRDLRKILGDSLYSKPHFWN